MMAGQLSEFKHVETFPFLEWQLRNYMRSYGDKRDVGRRPGDKEGYRSQRGNSDMVYTFKYAPSGETPPKPRIKYPPAKQDLLNSSECRLKEVYGDRKKQMVEEIYQLFLSYVQGIHIG